MEEQEQEKEKEEERTAGAGEMLVTVEIACTRTPQTPNRVTLILQAHPAHLLTVAPTATLIAGLAQACRSLPTTFSFVTYMQRNSNSSSTREIFCFDVIVSVNVMCVEYPND